MKKKKKKKHKSKKKHQIVNVTKARRDLTAKLDGIDANIERQVYDGFYQSRLRIEMGMWRKGKAIAAYFSRVNHAVSCRKVGRVTGRSDQSIRRWYSLYKNHPNQKDYQVIAEEKAVSWTAKVFDKMQARIEAEERGKLVGDEQDEQDEQQEQELPKTKSERQRTPSFTEVIDTVCERPIDTVCERPTKPKYDFERECERIDEKARALYNKLQEWKIQIISNKITELGGTTKGFLLSPYLKDLKELLKVFNRDADSIHKISGISHKLKSKVVKKKSKTKKKR